MMKLLRLAVVLAAGSVCAALGTSPALADQVVVVTSCGSQTLTAGMVLSATFIDTTGTYCTSSAGGTNPAQGSTTSGQTGPLVQGAVTTAAPSYTTAQTNPLSLDTTGNLRVLDKNSAALLAAAQASIPTGANTIGNVGLVATPTGGQTTFTLTAAASTNATNVKASAGTLYHIGVYNNSATLAWVSFYNTAGTPTCGTSIVYQTMIPANSTSGAGAVEDFATGLNFSTGIGICVATGIAGTGSVAATSYVVGLGYK